MKAKKSHENGAGPDAIPRSRAQIILSAMAALTALAGLADATYLAVAHLAGEHIACGGSSTCSEVLSSKYAAIGGLPVAGLGAAGYFVAFSLATLVAFGYRTLRKYLALTVTAMLFATLWFLYLQAFVLHAYCQYCLLSAACTFLLAGLLLALPPKTGGP